MRFDLPQQIVIESIIAPVEFWLAVTLKSVNKY